MKTTSQVKQSESAQILYARLRALHSNIHSVLIAAPNASDLVADAASRLAEAAERAGEVAEYVNLLEFKKVSGNSSSSTQSAWSRSDISQRIGDQSGLLVLYGGGLLDAPAAVLAASEADGVLMAALRGRTTREELLRARLLSDQAGGRLIASILLT